MFNKKVKIFLITLVVMLSISAVFAADTNTTDDATLGEVDEEPPSISVQDNSVDENAVGNDNEPLVSSVQNESAIGNEVPLASVQGNSTDEPLEASKTAYTLEGKDVRMYYKNGTCFEVTLLNNSKPVAKQIVSITINGKTFNKKTDDSGKVSLLITLAPGTYTAYSTYNGITVKNKIKVFPVVVASDLVKTYRSNDVFIAKFLDNDGSRLKNTKVKFIIDGKTYTRTTNAKGFATLPITLYIGSYKIYSVHPNGYNVSNNIQVKTSIVVSNLVKHYGSYKVFSAKFYGKDGKPLANKYIQFYRKGDTFNVMTNSKGVASITVISAPGSFNMVSINPETGQQRTRTVTILPTMSADSVTTFSDRTATFKVTLYRNEKLVKNAKVYVYINGVKKSLKTDANGVASVSFKLSAGTYSFKSYDPYTDSNIYTKVYVKLASIKANDGFAVNNKKGVYIVTLLKQNGALAKNTNMQIILNGKTYNVKTNAQGAGSITFTLKKGTYKVTSKDLATGYTITKKIYVYDNLNSYSKYGVSSDGSTILAIGRPSAPGDASEYVWYKTEFVRTCPYCGGHNLYWDVFWAGDETTEVGIFPATGNKEPGSTEGMIFCADCDCDFSVFGNEHVWENQLHLTAISKTVKSSKEEAYLLKSGNYVSA